MHKLGINFDEISDDLDIALRVMEEEDVKFGELRTLDQKNFVFWTNQEVTEFQSKIAASKVQLVAAATPLFKWYIDPSHPDIEHDSFGFNPRLSEQDKVKTIERTISIAAKLDIPRLRIFSGLGTSRDVIKDFAQNSLLKLAVDLAKQNSIELYLENEPVCIASRKSEIIDVFQANTSANFKFWLDIANMCELNEKIDEQFLTSIINRVGYIHVKDYLVEGSNKLYVPVGEGGIDYAHILGNIFSMTGGELVITVETHAKEDKINSSITSIRGTKAVLDRIGVDYE